MLKLDISLSTMPTSTILGDTIDMFWNVSAAGIASGSVGTAPVNGKPIPLCREPAFYWGTTPWGSGGWCGYVLASETFTTPSVHFGLAKVALKSRDSIGNYQSGGANETEYTVNSTPQAPTRFSRGSWSSPQQAFTFEESLQLKV